MLGLNVWLVVCVCVCVFSFERERNPHFTVDDDDTATNCAV